MPKSISEIRFDNPTPQAIAGLADLERTLGTSADGRRALAEILEERLRLGDVDPHLAIEPGVQQLVAAFALHHVPTCNSCEGHMRGEDAHSVPWISVKMPEEPYKYRGQAHAQQHWHAALLLDPQRRAYELRSFFAPGPALDWLHAGEAAGRFEDTLAFRFNLLNATTALTERNGLSPEYQRWRDQQRAVYDTTAAMVATYNSPLAPERRCAVIERDNLRDGFGVVAYVDGLVADPFSKKSVVAGSFDSLDSRRAALAGLANALKTIYIDSGPLLPNPRASSDR